MAWPIVKVTSGGIAVTEATNGFGTPVEVAANGYGTPVTYVSSGGLPVGTGGGSIPQIFGTRQEGDSFGIGESGGGGPDAYNSLKACLDRALRVACGVPITAQTITAITGSSSASAVTRWLARTAYYRFNYICTGRNDIATAKTAPAILADIDEIIAARNSYEMIVFGAVHNFNNGTEDAGSAARIKIDAVNAGMASRANGTTIFFADHRTECVTSYKQGDTPDTTAFTNDRPAPSVVVSVGDALHLNAIGTEIQANFVAFEMYKCWLLDNVRANLVTNGTFNVNVAGWSTFNGGVITWNAGGYADITGANGFKSAAQQVVASGANTKKYVAIFDYFNPSASSNVAFLARGIGGGSNAAYPAGFSTAFPGAGLFNPSETRNRRKVIVPFVSVNADLALWFEAQNSISATWSIDNIVCYEKP